MSNFRNLIPLFLNVFLILSISHAQVEETESSNNNEKQKSLTLKLKDGVQPLVYIDGKIYDADVVELLDQSKIASIDVIKGERAITEFNSPNGVVIIKSMSALQTDKAKNAEHPSQPEIKVRSKTRDDLEPVIIINGEVSDEVTLSKFKPEEIESINVLKGRAAVEKYDAPNGAVIVKTKGKK